MKKKFRITVICLSAFLSVMTGCDTDRAVDDGKAADIVVFGDIYTAENSEMKVEAFAVKDGRYVYAGDISGAYDYIGTKTDVIDHRGKGMVTPGYYESHAHYFMSEGMDAIDAVILNETQDTPDIFLEKIRAAHKEAKEAGRPAVFVYGWNFQLFDSMGMPTMEDMDDACPELPMYAIDAESHKGLANSACMLRAGIINDEGEVIIDQIRGGEILVDENGKATGLLKEQAGTYCRNRGIDFYSMLDETKSRAVVMESQKELLAKGFVSYMDGWTNYFGNGRFYEAVRSLDAGGDLTMCLGLSYEIESSTEDVKAEMGEAFNTLQYKTDHVNPCFIKLFMDGTVESSTGYVRTPYLDGTVGKANWKEDEVAEITSIANARDYTMHIHTMGDEAVHEVVNAFVRSGSKSARNTLVHVRNILSDDIALCAENDIVCVSGILWHCLSDFVKNYYRSFMPKVYIEESYPMKSYFDHGAVMTSHSDYPALSGGSEDPFEIMETAVTGLKPVEGQDEDPYWTKELISREQVLEALTINGAFQMHTEDERGSIKVGKWADFVLVDRDVMDESKCPDNEIHTAKVQKTFFEGEMVFERN